MDQQPPEFGSRTWKNAALSKSDEVFHRPGHTCAQTLNSQTQTQQHVRVPYPHNHTHAPPHTHTHIPTCTRAHMPPPPPTHTRTYTQIDIHTTTHSTPLHLTTPQLLWRWGTDGDCCGNGGRQMEKGTFCIWNVPRHSKAIKLCFRPQKLKRFFCHFPVKYSICVPLVTRRTSDVYFSV